MKTCKEILVLIYRWCWERKCFPNSPVTCCKMLTIAEDMILRGEY